MFFLGGGEDTCTLLVLLARVQQVGVFNQACMHVSSSCRSSAVGIVTIFDSQVTAQTISREELPATSGGNGWELCPVVQMLGIPLAIKKIAPCGCKICIGDRSPIAEPRSQVVRHYPSMLTLNYSCLMRIEGRSRSRRYCVFVDPRSRADSRCRNILYRSCTYPNVMVFETPTRGLVVRSVVHPVKQRARQRR